MIRNKWVWQDRASQTLGWVTCCSVLFPPVSSPFQLLVPQLWCSYQAAAASRSSPIKPWMLRQMCSCACSEAFKCSADSCGAECAAAKLTSLLTGTAMRCTYKPWGVHQPHGGKGSCAGMHGILLPTGQADVLGLESVSHSPPIISQYWRLTPWRDSISFPSPCQSFPSSSSPLALPHPSLWNRSYIFPTFRGSLRGCWLIIAGFGDFNVEKVTLVTDGVTPSPHETRRVSASLVDKSTAQP